MAERLTITVVAGGEDANARAFSAVLDDVLDALEAIAKEKGESVEWRIVALEKNSPAKVTLGAVSKAMVVATFLRGISQLQEAPASPFAIPAIRAVKRLGDRIGKSVDSVLLESDGIPDGMPTPQMARNAAESLAAGFYRVPGSVDGKLDIVNVHATTKFSIFDDVDGREIRCTFPETMFDIVKRNIGKRVTAIGDVRYNSQSDAAVSINVESIEPLEENEEPKLFSEMPTIDLAPGRSSEEYVRQLRDGE